MDMRISTLPTHFGEKVVIRILDPKSTLITLDQLGFSEQRRDQLNEILDRPQGMLLVTGPTGSGKSTTLYAALNVLRSPDINIVTVENPVEFMLDGVNQVQVHSKVGLTFASCLSSILRQDPDVIMVGEIRNVETAEMAMNASQTGHLVLSTLHTNDSVGAVTRLLDLGIPAYLIAESVSAIIAQRLARRFCPCRRQVPATPSYIKNLQRLGVRNIEAFKFEYQIAGCSQCDNMGYKGRVGIYEMLAIKDAVRDAVHSEAKTQDILELARQAGFQTMQEDALEKLKAGVTSLDEIKRVVPWAAANSQKRASDTFITEDQPEQGIPV
jgi:type IV pilus assembly protein PilB